MHILHVVGARPNFIKAAPVMRALASRQHIRQTLVHTGQHYDASMSDVFFQELDMPEPDICLEAGSGSHARQTAEIISRFEPVVLERKPDLVLIYGDVNSTVAAALVCAKLLIPVAHVEAGLRSFDRSMPEEINRLLTDRIADLLFTPSACADENLLREGVAPEKIHFVGNVMIDTLVRFLPEALARWPIRHLTPVLPFLRSTEGSQGNKFDLQHFGLVTLHRPSNVDNPGMLASIVATLGDISRDLPLLLPIHPRTRQRLESSQVTVRNSRLHLVEPLRYLDFLVLQRNAKLVITDSGGVQEETTYLGVPCLTLRENTERPVTVTMGTNILVGREMERLRVEVARILAGDGKRGQVPPLWDGHAAKRIADVILEWGRLE